MIRPKKLKFGDTIGVTFPASGASEDEVVEMKKLLEGLGFKVKLGKTALASYGYLSGEDELRAEDLNNLFADPEVDGIICGRGGYGSPRILDMIDYNLIRENPKVFVGYSDITALHLAFNKLSSLVTFHGPMTTSDMIHSFSNETRESLFAAIMGGQEEREISSLGGPGFDILVHGVGEGEIIGGNLSLISDTLASKCSIDSRGKLLFIEEIEEEPRNIDRMLNQLRLAGIIDEAEGIILGSFTNCLAKRPNSFTTGQVLDQYFSQLKKPVIYNYQAGHCEPSLTIPFGVRARLDTWEKKLVLLEAGTI